MNPVEHYQDVLQDFETAVAEVWQSRGEPTTRQGGRQGYLKFSENFVWFWLSFSGYWGAIGQRIVFPRLEIYLRDGLRDGAPLDRSRPG